MKYIELLIFYIIISIPIATLWGLAFWIKEKRFTYFIASYYLWFGSIFATLFWSGLLDLFLNENKDWIVGLTGSLIFITLLIWQTWEDESADSFKMALETINGIRKWFNLPPILTTIQQIKQQKEHQKFFDELYDQKSKSNPHNQSKIKFIFNANKMQKNKRSDRSR